MPERLGVGLFLPGDAEHLAAIADLLGEADFFEISPENLWTHEMGDLPATELLLEVARRTGKPFIGHGLGFSLGTPLQGEAELERTRRWLDKLRQTQSRFGMRWYSEHLGFATTISGLSSVLPLPLPHTREAEDTVAARLELLRQVVPQVGFENSVFYFTLGDPLWEADFYNRICRRADCDLLLDLHNVHTHCLNFGLDAHAFSERIELSRVSEIHLSGGSESQPQWLEGQVMRLDSHDAPVPEPVWDLYEWVLPRCPRLRAVTLERLPGTFSPGDVELFGAEFRRARAIAHAF